eukprot:3555174-Pyramimonas_sp.AAC.1
MRQLPVSATPLVDSLAAAAGWDASKAEPFDLNIRASRIKWDYAPSFDPSPYLDDPWVRAAFHDPEVMRLPPEAWPDGFNGARVHMERSELWDLLRKWDFCGALYLTPTGGLRWDEAC